MEPSRDKKQIEPRNHFMFGCHSTRRYQINLRPRLPLQKIIPTWLGCRMGLWTRAGAPGVLFVFLALPTQAAWQPGEITVGDGKGGSTTYPVQKQKIQAPGYKYVMPFGLAQMDDGRIILVASTETEKTQRAVVSYSSDEGNTWSPFEPIPTSRPAVLTYLGGSNL